MQPDRKPTAYELLVKINGNRSFEVLTHICLCWVEVGYRVAKQLALTFTLEFRAMENQS